MAWRRVATASGYSERRYTYPSVAPVAYAAMAMPSIRQNGSPSISIRSAKVPESPSSALQQTNFSSPSALSTVFHLIPAGKPAPPRPRSPESVTSLTTSAGSMASARRSPAMPPLAR